MPKRIHISNALGRAVSVMSMAAACLAFLASAKAEEPSSASKITLDDAIRIALQRNHDLRATRTTIAQSQADERTAGLRPNPTFSASWGNLPLAPKPAEGYGTNIRDSSSVDLGLSYEFELGRRGRRMDAAKAATAVTKSQVAKSELDISFQVASQFVNVQLAESNVELAEENLKSFQQAVDLAQMQYKSGGASENDYLKISLQLLQFQTDLEQARLAKSQMLSDLRQLLGYESVSPGYDVVGPFEYTPLALQLRDLEAKAIDTRPDLRAAFQNRTVANSQYSLAKANGVPNLTVSADWVFSGGIQTAAVGVSIPLPIFDRNQGEVSKAVAIQTQAQEQYKGQLGQVLTDVKDAFDALQTNDRVLQHYQSGYVAAAKKSLEISEYSYRRGLASLLDFLDAERSYRATQLAYRQAIAAYLVALEQVRQAVGTRRLR
jgi:cobalt-zinc-cadmium efflux system outer membrane protein